MKKSHGITLTVVAAMGMAAKAQDPPVPAAAVTCQDRRKVAKAAGTPFTEKCSGGFFGAHGVKQSTARGGFGATGGGTSGGG